MRTGVEEEEDIVQRRERKNSKKTKKNNNGIFDRNVDDKEVGLRKDDRKKKKKEKKKGEAQDDLDLNAIGEEYVNEKEWKNEVELISTKEKNKKVSRNREENVDVDDNEVGLRKDDKKKKRREKRDGMNDELDLNVVGETLISNNDHGGAKNGKKRKLKHKKDEEQKYDVELVFRKEKKRKKDRTNKNKEDMGSSSTDIVNDKKVGKDKENKGLESYEKEGVSDVRDSDELHKVKGKRKEKKGKKDKKGRHEVSAEWKKESAASYEEFGKEKDQFDGGCMAKVEHKGKDKKRRGGEKETLDVVVEKKYKKKRKKANSVEDVEERSIDNGEPRTKNTEGGVDHSGDSKLKRPSKRVKFSQKVEVFPLSDDGADAGEENQEEKLVRGKRFSLEEDEMLKEAIFKYVRERGLGDKEGVNMVLHCRSHPEVKHCWKEIATALPWRPYESIYSRGHVLFERNEQRVWTTEEKELVRKFHKQYGPDWRLIGDVLDKHRHHVKDTWRRIKFPNLKKGRWSQDEYQTLFDLVNLDLRMKAFEERKSKHGMLRDNISWEAISEKLSTRLNSSCCLKWYNALTSPLVKQGQWADVDDYRLLNMLVALDASCVEDVDWDSLLDHRDGDVCRKRWNQMVRNIGEYKDKSFAEQVEVLAKRYDPDLLEVREAFDNAPIIP